MLVGVGYGENPDSEIAGTQAAKEALAKAGRSNPDLVFLFATASHNAAFLRSVVASVVGKNVCIVGGGAIGVITNDRLGYSHDQVGVAAVWLDGVGLNILAKGGIIDNEINVGKSIGRKLRQSETPMGSPIMLFYDSINRSMGDVRLNLATPLLQGIESELGFLPNLVGAGLQGDFECSPYMQWVGSDTVAQYAFMLAFSGDLKLDSVIMHGCKPKGDYFTVTKAERQTILEINGEPAIPFLDKQLRGAVSPDEYPFFMILGVNQGDPRLPFEEKNYANRLCLGLDKERNGIVMFESDMVAGTRFQIMYRAIDMDYIPPKINAMFDNLGKRKPVFAFYINCAGRAASYSGTEVEDAAVVQQAVAGRVPLLGIYSGVEIAPISGRPRTLDWTGVFCLFSEPAGK